MAAQPARCLRTHPTGRRLVRVDTHTHTRARALAGHEVTTTGAACCGKVGVGKNRVPSWRMHAAIPHKYNAALKATSQGHGMGTESHVWINISFFRLLRGHSRRLLTRMLLPSEMSLIVLMTMETADYTECELTLKLKPAFLLFLCYITIACSSFWLSVGNTSLNFSNFKISILKYFFLLSLSRR